MKGARQGNDNQKKKATNENKRASDSCTKLALLMDD